MTRTWTPFALGLAAVALAGCAGKQYVQPAEGATDVATVNFKPYSRMSSSSLHVVQFNAKGCYQGYTSVPGESGTPLRLHAGQERHFAMYASSGPDSCRVVVSFTPEAKVLPLAPATATVRFALDENARYRLVELSESPSGLFKARRCGVRVERAAADGQFKGVSARHWQLLQAGVKCFRLAPADGASSPTLPIAAPVAPPAASAPAGR